MLRKRGSIMLIEPGLRVLFALGASSLSVPGLSAVGVSFLSIQSHLSEVRRVRARKRCRPCLEGAWGCKVARRHGGFMVDSNLRPRSLYRPTRPRTTDQVLGPAANTNTL